VSFSAVALVVVVTMLTASAVVVLIAQLGTDRDTCAADHRTENHTGAEHRQTVPGCCPHACTDAFTTAFGAGRRGRRRNRGGR
jgi:hypothetical protein